MAPDKIACHENHERGALMNPPAPGRFAKQTRDPPIGLPLARLVARSTASDLRPFLFCFFFFLLLPFSSPPSFHPSSRSAGRAEKDLLRSRVPEIARCKAKFSRPSTPGRISPCFNRTIRRLHRTMLLHASHCHVSLSSRDELRTCPCACMKIESKPCRQQDE